MENGFDVLIKRLGVVSSDVWFYSAQNVVAPGGSAFNTGYVNSTFLGDCGKDLYRVPPGHVLALTDLSLSASDVSTTEPHLLRCFFDKINGLTRETFRTYFNYQDTHNFHPAALLPENTVMGWGLTNNSPSQGVFVVHMHGWLWRLEQGKPVTAGGL